MWGLSCPALAGQAITYRFSAPPSCGSSLDFEEGVERRLTDVTLVPDESASVHVQLEPVGAKIRAELVMLRGDGTSLSRVIETESCDSAVRAIAFVAAVALDAEIVENTEWRRETQPPQTQNPSFTAPAEEEAKVETESEQNAVPPTLSLGLLGSMAGGTAPSPLFGGGAFLEMRTEPAGLWAPVVRLSANYLRRGAFGAPGGTARFEQGHVDVDLCPSQVHWGPLRGEPCVFLGAGGVRTTGLDSEQTERFLRPWLGAGGSVAARLELSRWIFLLARGAVGTPFIRDQYRFDSAVFYRTDPLYYQVGVGFSVRLF